MANVRITVDHDAALSAINNAPGLSSVLSRHTSAIVAKANALGAGYTTSKWHDHKTGETKGGTTPLYAGDVRKGKKGPIDIVHPKNYAAMKDNYLHNTMLKSM